MCAVPGDIGPLEFIVTFAATRDAIDGEKKLLAAGLPAGVMPLPAELGAGCGICLRVSPAELEKARAALGINFQEVYAVRAAAGSSGAKSFSPWNP
jgi:hypothetical protein